MIASLTAGDDHPIGIMAALPQSSITPTLAQTS